MSIPIIDLHCDLLSYMQGRAGADPLDRTAIGCSLPALQEGKVKIQLLAFYTSTESGSTKSVAEQSELFQQLPAKYPLYLQQHEKKNGNLSPAFAEKTRILPAIENASGFCEENEQLDAGLNRLKAMNERLGGLLYIGITHHGENRFGGGNATTVGLKEDGKSLLEFIDGMSIAIDFSHTSDALAEGILNHIDKKNLAIPVLASHSNFRTVFQHARNLPDEFAKEIVRRQGIIGMNFLRAFLNNHDANALYDHIEYGFAQYGEKSICFGADYFYTKSHPDQSRIPFYYPGQDDASCYPAILSQLASKHRESAIRAIANENALAFIQRVYAAKPAI